MFFAIRRLWFVALALCGVGSLGAAVTVERSVGPARISQVASLPAVDLVVLDSGFEAGFRHGMVCSVTREGKAVGELLLVDLSPRAANALILDLASDEGLRPGDIVVVKTISSRK